MTIMPHNHEMWAVIGIYTGREDNMFWRRVEGAPDGHIEAAGAKRPVVWRSRAARPRYHSFRYNPIRA